MNNFDEISDKSLVFNFKQTITFHKSFDKSHIPWVLFDADRSIHQNLVNITQMYADKLNHTLQTIKEELR